MYTRMYNGCISVYVVYVDNMFTLLVFTVTRQLGGTDRRVDPLW